jgi:hypothetical protein
VRRPGAEDAEGELRKDVGGGVRPAQLTARGGDQGHRRVARSLTNTFAGIAPHDVPYFIVAQLIGAGCAAALAHWLFDQD